jgi:SAM-dependent methyltransferase
MNVDRAVYRDDLAYIHEAGFLAYVNEAGPGVLRALRGSGIHDGLIVDVGCGTGVLAAALSAVGFEVLGIDISRAMIAIARRRARRVTFKIESLYRATIPRCRAVTAIGECLNYAFDGRGGSRGLSTWFRRVYRALEPGGVLIFDIAEPGQIGRAAGTNRRHALGDGWAVLVDLEERTNPPRLVRTITTFRKVGARYRRALETHHLDLYRRAQIGTLLRTCGFRVQFKRGYGIRPLPPAHAVVIARKPQHMKDELRPRARR